MHDEASPVTVVDARLDEAPQVLRICYVARRAEADRGGRAMSEMTNKLVAIDMLGRVRPAQECVTHKPREFS